jgi:hypothetical protein
VVLLATRTLISLSVAKSIDFLNELRETNFITRHFYRSLELELPLLFGLSVLSFLKFSKTNLAYACCN